MSDVRDIPDYWRCKRHGSMSENTGAHSSGLECQTCSDERDAAVDELVGAAWDVASAMASFVDTQPLTFNSGQGMLGRLIVALERFGYQK